MTLSHLECADCRHFAACDASLQACLSKHKGDSTEATKKRHKKEVLMLVTEYLAAVQDLG